MKILVCKRSPHGASVQQDVDVSAQELAEVLVAGDGVYVRSTETNSGKHQKKFVAADVAFVTIDSAKLSVERALAAPFTAQYLTAAVHPKAGETGKAILAFELAKPVSDSYEFRDVLRGLQAMYAGAKANDDVFQDFGGGVALTESVVPGYKLTSTAQADLARFGRETYSFGSKAYMDGALPRSRIHLDASLWLDVAHADSEQAAYGQPVTHIPSHVTVFCPVHVDDVATATLTRDAKGRPVVICKRCGRSYGSDNRPRYDFGLVDRVFHDLAADETKALGSASDQQALPMATLVDDGLPLQFTVVRERYLPVLPVVAGITCVKSGKGTGKTHQLKALVDHLKVKKQRVLLIGHRRTLLQSLAEKIGLTNYFHSDTALDADGTADEDDPESSTSGDEQRDGFVRVEPTDHYAISLDSLDTLDPAVHLYGVILIDECEQVFSHLISMTLKEKRKQVYLTLCYYLRAAKSVYLLDADLNMITMDTLFNVGLKPETPFYAIKNEPMPQLGGETFLYASDKQLTAVLVSAVVAGEKCFVATNSIKEVKRLAQAITTAKPKARVVCVHSENSHSVETQALIANLPLELERNIDVLIASPAMGTGVDISYRDEAGNPRVVVDKVFGKFLRNITTHFDVDQAVMRVREPGQVHVWVDTWQLAFECEPAVLKMMLEDAVSDTHRLLGFTDDGKPVLAPEDGLVDIWARISAASRGSKNQLAELYEGLRRQNGFTVTRVKLDEEDKEKGAAMMKAARAEVEAQREQALMDAEEIDSTEAADLAEQDKTGAAISAEERVQLDRYRMESFYAEDISPELIAFDDDARMREKIRNLECLTLPNDVLKRTDAADHKADLPFDRRLVLLRRKMLGQLLGATGLFSEATGKFSPLMAVEQGRLTEFARLTFIYRKRLQLVFSAVVRRDVREKPVLQLGDLLDLVGLSLGEAEVRQSGNKKVRFYRLDESSLETALNVVARRDEARAQKDGEPADKSQNGFISAESTDLSGRDGGEERNVAHAAIPGATSGSQSKVAASFRDKLKRLNLGSNDNFTV